MQKRRFEQGISLEVKENPKSFWKFVRSKTQTRSGISDLKNKDGEWITNDKDKANEMNGLVGLIKRAFSYLDEETLLVLYKTLIRPILDYGNTIWFPTLKKDIRAIENVQRRLTKILPELSHISYEERIRKLNLTTLNYRRHRMDMIQAFKIINKIDDIKMEGLFEFSDSITRGHSLKLKKPRVLKSFRMNSFSIRAIDKWNNLTEDIVNSSTVLSFKTMYNRYMGDQKYHTGDIY